MNQNDYFSQKMQREYMSTSQFKSFMNCSAKAMAEICGAYEQPNKEAFLAGHMFEALVSGNPDIFYEMHPEIISSQGKTKGNVKSNFIKVIDAAEAFNKQKVFRKIVNRCEKQVFVSGTIAGVKFKGLLDLYDPKTGEIYDIKCMKDFSDTYSESEGRRVAWWQNFGYHYQAAIYCELVRQTFKNDPTFSLIAASKETVPDVAYIKFDNEYLRNVMDIIEENVPLYQAIKEGMIEPERCEKCDYCRKTKIINLPELIECAEEYEND